MYLEHFGLREQPFSPTPDPKFLYCSPEHAEALAALHYGISERRGFAALIAAPGMGKTTLLYYLLERWKGRAQTAFVFHPPETREQMMAAVLEDLGLAPTGNYCADRRRLQNLALECVRVRKRLLLVFDEAQKIPLEVLEEIRLLSNLETPEEKLIEVVLAGQPALAACLSEGGAEQLRQRIAVWARLGPLDSDEVGRYAEHRLRVAGCGAGNLFARSALSAVAREAQGVPRRINALCFDALSSAFAQGKKRVHPRHVPGALAAQQPARGVRRVRLVTAATVLLAAGALLAGAYLEHAPRMLLPVWQSVQAAGMSHR
jgi:general secretion pathway protein A